jgi:nucleoside-diphosphate-sugar epimerase
LISHLLAAGHAVRNLDLNVYLHAGASLGLLQNAGYEYVHGDMGDAAARHRALEGISDVVVLGGLVGDPITKAFPEESHAINDVAVRAFIDDLDGRGLNKVVFVSTCSNYGIIPEGTTADEGWDLNPLSLYAKSKVAAEKHLLSLEGRVDYSPTILRFATAFGIAPRMRFDLTVNEFTRDLYLGGALDLFDADTWRPYCHVRDFARLIDRVLRFPIETVAFEVFNAGGDRNNHTKRGIVDLIRERVPDARVKVGGASGDGRNYCVSFRKVLTKLYFEPRYGVADGIDEIIEVLRMRLLDDVEQRRDFYGNRALPGLHKASGTNGSRLVARPAEMRSAAS